MRAQLCSWVVGGGGLLANSKALRVTLVFGIFIAMAQTPLPVAVSASQTDSVNTVPRADSLATRTPVSRADTAMIVKHHFNHKQQIITGSIIMACMATMVVVMNNYNPQGLNQ